MKKLKMFLQYFVSITTGILIVVTFFCALSQEEALPENVLMHILMCSFLTAIDTTFLFPGENAGKKQALFMIFLHFASLCVLVAFFGIHFGWFHPDIGGVLTAVISVALVYAFTFGVNYLIETQQANRMNKALQGKYSREDD